MAPDSRLSSRFLSNLSIRRANCSVVLCLGPNPNCSSRSSPHSSLKTAEVLKEMTCYTFINDQTTKYAKQNKTKPNTYRFLTHLINSKSLEYTQQNYISCSAYTAWDPMRLSACIRCDWPPWWWRQQALWNFGKLLPDYTALHLWGRWSLFKKCFLVHLHLAALPFGMSNAFSLNFLVS
jgi:hypothetical protein